jgi:hypothetical protein
MEVSPDLDLGPTTFATLTPCNAKAKIMFSAVAEALLRQSQRKRPAFAKFMSISPQQVYDPDAALLLRQLDAAGIGNSDSVTEADTDTEEANALSNHIWRGAYIFSLDHRSAGSNTVWVAGKGRGGVEDSVDMRLALQSDKRADKIRGYHARFQLDRNGYMQISVGNFHELYLAVNGSQIDYKKPRHIVVPTAKVQAGDLVFDFAYTSYARSLEFTQIRDTYVQQAHNLDDVLSLTITPAPPLLPRIIGEWTLNMNLGRGATGKVYSAANDLGDVVAIKHVDNTKRTAKSVSEEVKTLRTLTEEARQANHKHIIQLKELLPDSISQHLFIGSFQDLYMVLTPACPRTLADYDPAKSTDDNCVLFLRDSLLALQFLHDRRWLHRDIKPANIGIHSHRAVLLDFGCAFQLPDDEQHIPARPGANGTINYLSPERERTRYGRADDVWALAVSLFEAVFRRHPWRLAVNPWRIDQARYLGDFHNFELSAHNQLQQESSDSLENLLSAMLRHEWSACNPGLRVQAKEALRHPVFDTLEDNAAPIKKKVKF